MKRTKIFAIFMLICLAMASTIFFVAADGCNVTEPTLSYSISAVNPRLRYFIGEELDNERIRINSYADNTHRFVYFSDAAVTITGFNSSQAVAAQTITISYGELTTTMVISVEAVLPERIATVTGFRAEYEQGSPFDYRGTVTIRYNNHSTRQLLLSDPAILITGFDSSEITDRQVLTIMYIPALGPPLETTINIRIV